MTLTKSKAGVVVLPTEELREEHREIEVALTLFALICDQANKGTKHIANFKLMVDFFLEFADKSHHREEEILLFPALIFAGVRKRTGLINELLQEHDIGRKYMREIGYLARQARFCMTNIDVARNYIKEYSCLLREHIRKEDQILYPLAESILPLEHQQYLCEEFEHMERQLSPGVHAHYRDVIKKMNKEYIDNMPKPYSR